jgi:pimeloyl-ACP methyl ester carboxylesterase
VTVTLHVRVHDGGSDGPPVVLVHGSMDRGAAFARVVPLLGSRQVVRYDRRGYGRSIDPDVDPPGVDGHAQDLLAVIDQHAGGAAVVIGHSLGADVALVAADRRPEAVLAVGAYEMPMPWEPWWSTGSAGGATIADADAHGAGAGAERFLRRMVGDDRWESMSAAEQDARRAEGPALIAELRSLRNDGPPFDVAALRCPVRTACGSASKEHHRRGAHELARLVGDVDGPTVIEGAQHGAHRSHPEAFAAWAANVLPVP